MHRRAEPHGVGRLLDALGGTIASRPSCCVRSRRPASEPTTDAQSRPLTGARVGDGRPRSDRYGRGEARTRLDRILARLRDVGTMTHPTASMKSALLPESPCPSRLILRVLLRNGEIQCRALWYRLGVPRSFSGPTRARQGPRDAVSLPQHPSRARYGSTDDLHHTSDRFAIGTQGQSSCWRRSSSGTTSLEDRVLSAE